MASNTPAIGSVLSSSNLAELMDRALTVSNPPQSLKDLPDELLLEVIDELDEADLCALGSTCKAFNNLVFPFFFAKHNIYSPFEGYISCFQVPEHSLRAIRCSLSAKNISTIRYYFNDGINRLVEEVEELQAVVKLTEVMTSFKADLRVPDYWGYRDARLLDQALLPRLTEKEWTKLYIGLLTAALTRGVEHAELSGGDSFLEYLQDRDEYMAENGNAAGPVSSFMERVLAKKSTRYFDGSFRFRSLFSQPKRSSWVTNVEQPSVAEDTVVQTNESSGKPPIPAVEELCKRLSKWMFPTNNKNSGLISSTAAYESGNHKVPIPHSSSRAKGFKFILSSGPEPRLQSLILHADMFFGVPSFQSWTTQLLSWCAPTLTYLELQFPKQPTQIWCKTFPELRLPSLIDFKGSCSRSVLEARIQGSDILSFLSKNPSIERITLERLQAPYKVWDLPRVKGSILPSLTEITAHPIYISWLLGTKKSCPKLQEVTLLTGYADVYPTFDYRDMDNALEDLLPHLHKLKVVGFHLNNDHIDLNVWLQSHIDADPNVSSLSRFTGTKCIRFNSRYYVGLIDDKTRLNLAAQFVGLFPNVEDLEFLKHPGALRGTTKYIPPVAEALRLYSPQLKTVKFNDYPPIDIANFGQP
ncbi:hypothetical protein MD484_g4222, partial [Candolleomyces efflorescens]